MIGGTVTSDDLEESLGACVESDVQLEVRIRPEGDRSVSNAVCRGDVNRAVRTGLAAHSGVKQRSYARHTNLVSGTWPVSPRSEPDSVEAWRRSTSSCRVGSSRCTLG
nr:MAG TPA: hypothetical protein [Caudoviricetes sp.]